MQINISINLYGFSLLFMLVFSINALEISFAPRAHIAGYRNMDPCMKIQYSRNFRVFLAIDN